MSLCNFSPQLHAEAQPTKTKQKIYVGTITIAKAAPADTAYRKREARLPQSEFLEIFTEKFPSIFTLLSAR